MSVWMQVFIGAGIAPGLPAWVTYLGHLAVGAGAGYVVGRADRWREGLGQWTWRPPGWWAGRR
jgi:hypothetical protein